MWTPKRLLLLLLGTVVFTAAYGVYAHFLGRVDGLPALPEDFAISASTEIDTEQRPVIEIEVDRKLKLAFGVDCAELKRTIKIEVKARGIVVATDQFIIERGGERDGQVRMEPFSIAIYGKPRGKDAFPEINTVRSDIAYLTFDQPINSPAEINSHKIVGAELVCRLTPQVANTERERRGLEGGVCIVNNRRTPERDDDMTLRTPGPVFFQEKLNQIWTREVVKIIDEQSKPNPTEVTAIGMDVYLANDDPVASSKPAVGEHHKAKNTGAITGVKSVVLRSDVDMHLEIDGKSGFMGAPSKRDPKAKADAKKTPKEQPRKDPVHIQTQGPFHYDVQTDVATFDISQHPGPHLNDVKVTRKHEQMTGAYDQLVCSHLELKLTRKSASETPAPADDDRGANLEIETSHAWGDGLTLTSDSESLVAFGDDLVYSAKTRESVLKGTVQMTAMKDGNEIDCKMLTMYGTGSEKDGQQAMAKGPGVVKILNRQTGKRTQEARFKEAMYVSKEAPYDVLLLVGEASFVDQEQKQDLKGERIKVWLEPDNTAPPAKPAEPAAKPPDPGAASPSHRRPHHLEATGHVSAFSPGETNIHDADRLVVYFEDVAPDGAATPPPAAGAAPLAVAPVVAPPRTPPKADEASPAPKPEEAARVAPAAPPAVTEPADKRPIDLQAHYVEAHVLRGGDKNELKRLWCEGDVHVHQEPSDPKDPNTDTDIEGDTLQLLTFPEGHILTVTGDLAKVKMEKLRIVGPRVTIDQKENKSWVEGAGFMVMPSDTGLDGTKQTKVSDLTVHWNRNMFFNGKNAEFHGGDDKQPGVVQAEQDGGRLICETLQVTFDRLISLKQGSRTGPPAKVQKLVCDKRVWIEDTKLDETTRKLISYQRLEAPVVAMDNEESVVTAPGPGVVRLLRLGDKDDDGPTAPRAVAKASSTDEELKLTRINFLGSMFANNVTHTAIFHDSVEVVNVPTDDANLPIDLDKLPKRALYLRCDVLKVYSRRDAAGVKANQEMEARGRASVQSEDFSGRADTIKFDEAKDLVIFEAGEGNLATLFKQEGRGAPPKELKGKKIYYWRKTNDFKIEGGRVIGGQDNGPPAKPTPATPAPRPTRN